MFYDIFIFVVHISVSLGLLVNVHKTYKHNMVHDTYKIDSG